MEENSEAHMDTDVSSTTDDVPETQEVTGSHGNVEMVIVVEKIKEEEQALKVFSNIQSNNQPSLQDNDKTPSSSDTVINVKESANGNEIQSQKTVPKSPNKDVQTQKSTQSSPVRLENTQISPNKDLQLNKTVQLPIPQQMKEIMTSPSQTETQNTQNKISESNPLPDTDTQNTLQKSPVHEIQSQDLIKLSPIKEPLAPETSDVSGKVDSIEVNKPEEVVSIAIPLDITIEKEASNDSQMETNSDTSEREHNKSISRELKSLINSAKESKIISECTQLTSKTRKSRTAADTSNTSLNITVEADKIQGHRRGSNNSQKSNSSEKSEKTTMKRSMRSQNPEFVNKVKQFLNSVTGKIQKNESDGVTMSDDDLDETKSKDEYNSSTPKKKKTLEEQIPEKSNKLRTDPYCWRCHWAIEQAANEKSLSHPPVRCTVCPRSFHFKCLTGTERNKIVPEKSWVCPECMTVLHAESSETRSPAMKKISLGMLCELLKFALERMMDLNGVEPFMQPVDRAAFPDYDKYVVHPMDLSLMKENIAEGLYGSTEAFLADAQWILHNSIIFNTLQSKLTGGARALVRSCRAEMGEIEACPECYAAAHARRPTWFTDVCSTPHVLLWAKLKGFPYWPAKGMSVSSAGLVDVRFFGAHDRAWVPARDCFLYSEKDPNNFRTKRQDILDSMQEAEQHIRNISRKYGKFVYPPFKSQFDPAKLNEQLKMMIPAFEGEVRTTIKEKPMNTSPSMVKLKSRSNSKSSKDSLQDCDMSEGEDIVAPSRKMADGAEIAREEEDFSIDKDRTMEVDLIQSKENDISRKRRRSDLEEAVITILESSKEKRKRLEDEEVIAEDKKIENLEKSTNETIEIDEKIVDQDKRKTDKINETVSKSEDPPNNTMQKDKGTPKVTPVRIIDTTKINKQTPRSNTPKDKDNVEKPLPQKQKPARREKSSSNEKEKVNIQDEKSKTQKPRSNSRNNRSLNNSTVRVDKNSDKKNESNIDNSSNNTKDKMKENSTNKNEKEGDMEKSISEKNTSTPKTNNSKGTKSTKDRIHFDDDDTSLAVIAREVAKNNIVMNSVPGLPTISSICSLSTNAESATTTRSATAAKTTEATVEAESDSSIFTPTSTNNVRDIRDAVNKLQKLRSDTEQPVVGRVGVRAFARITSPPEKTTKTTEDVQIEIKAEPIDYDDPERQLEKMDLMNAFRLRPVNANVTNLRDVRFNKVAVGPVTTRKVVAKPPEIRPRAKKTFPQPKKSDDGRSELNNKNSMVYIPIQPPMTQAPQRAPARPAPPATPASVSTHTAAAVVSRSTASITTNTANNLVNTVTTPLIPMTLTSSSSAPPPVVAAAVASAPTPTVSTAVAPPNVPTVGQVPATVHTVPLITSVNGQWTFSLQPVMSVGGVDSAPSPPMMNGVSERSNSSGTSGDALPAAVVSAAGAGNPTSSTSTATAAVLVPNKTTNDNNTPGEPPRLQQRPPLRNPLDPNTPIGNVPPPSTAGPLTAKLNQNAVKLTDFFRTLLEDSIEKLDEPATQLASLRLQLEQTRWRHQQEIDEIKHNHELILAEMRASFEKDKMRAISEVRRAAHVEMDAAVKHAKSKQWCANCSQEAQFYCCWNTSYCDYPCQRTHWAKHFAVCTQQRSQDGNNENDNDGNPSENRLQQQSENIPSSISAPTLTVGGKVTASRTLTQDQHKKPSIIVSMVEDTSGNQTMKCVGTYKPPSPAQPLILNKQLLNTEENATKKVMTSGGYLIYGTTASNSTSLVTSSRRTHIQYFT